MPKPTFAIVAVMLIAAIILNPFKLAAGNFSEVFAAVAPMQIVVDDDIKNVCTATSINAEQHYWLTAGHCVALFGEGDSGVRYINGDEVSIVLNNAEFDIAIVKTARAYAPALKLAKAGPAVGDSIMTVTYPLGFNAPIASFGQTASPAMRLPGDKRDRMIYNMSAAPGSSGSSVLNAKGEVVSIILSGWTVFGAMCAGATFEQLKTVTIGYWSVN